MFYIFIKACKKYKFKFRIIVNGGIASLVIIPKESYNEFCFSNTYNGFSELFFKAIIQMKQYRKKNKDNEKKRRYHRWVKFI